MGFVSDSPLRITSKKHRKILLIVGICIFLSTTFFILRTSSRYTSTQIPKTIGVIGEQLTISPDNRWLLYFERKYPFNDEYNFIAYDTVTDKKHTIDIGTINSAQLKLGLQDNCWSKDSKYCVLPVGVPKSDPRAIQRMKEISVVPQTAPWLQGKLIAVDSYPNNAPDIIIDFSNPENIILRTQYFDHTLVDRYFEYIYNLSDKPFKYQSTRITFDQLSPDGFTCSDCGNKVIREKHLNNNHVADEFYSPDERFIAQIVTTYLGGPGYITLGNKLYVIDTIKNTRHLVISDVFDELHFTSNSKGIYYYRCKNAPGCDIKTDASFYYTSLLDNIKPEGFSSATFNEFFITKHSNEEEIKDLEIIEKKEREEDQKILKIHYDTFVKDFKKPVKIVGANFDRFYTNNNRTVTLVADTSTLRMTAEDYKNLYVSLIGKTVTIAMPSFEEFIKTYQYETRDDYSLWGFKADGSEAISVKPAPSDPVYNKYYGLVYANVYLDGKKINDLAK